MAESGAGVIRELSIANLGVIEHTRLQFSNHRSDRWTMRDDVGGNTTEVAITRQCLGEQRHRNVQACTEFFVPSELLKVEERGA